jgi:hypothetical protein
MGNARSKSTVDTWAKEATNVIVKQWSSCENSQVGTQNTTLRSNGTINLSGTSISQSQQNEISASCFSQTENDIDLQKKIATQVANKADAQVQGLNFGNKSKSSTYTKVKTEIETNFDLSQVRSDVQKSMNSQNITIDASAGLIYKNGEIVQVQANKAVFTSVSTQLSKMQSIIDASAKVESVATTKVVGFTATSCLSSCCSFLVVVAIIVMIVMSSQGGG